MTQGTPIAVTGLKDPRDPSLWTRTPKNICDALARLGRLGPAAWGLPTTSAPVRLRTALATLAHGAFRQAQHMKWHRSVRALHAAAIATRLARELPAARVRHVLHFGGMTFLPLPDLPPAHAHALRQSLYIDSTADMWAHVIPGSRRFREGFISDFTRVYRSMHHIFTTAHYVRDALMQRHGVDSARVTAVGTGRGIIEPYHGPKDYTTREVLFASKVDFEIKGGPLLIDAFRLARAQRPDLRLTIVGHERTKQRYATEPGVTCHGFLPLAELQGIFNRAVLFAMPAINEPWGLVYLEAMACRTPVLGLNRRAMPELTDRGRLGFLVDEPRPEAVADALIRATDDAATLDRMGREAQAYVIDRFTWDHVARTIVETLDRA